MRFVFRWNVRKAIKVRKGTGFGHAELRLMHRIHDMERKVGVDTQQPNVGVVGLAHVEAFADTKETFCFGKMAPLTEDVADEEIRSFVELAAEVEDGDVNDIRFTHRGEVGEDAASHARFEASFQGTTREQVTAAFAALKPSHRWLAMQQKMFRPTLSPHHPSQAELDLAHEIKAPHCP